MALHDALRRFYRRRGSKRFCLYLKKTPMLKRAKLFYRSDVNSKNFGCKDSKIAL